MNWKKNKWIVMTALSALLLSACGSDSTTSLDENNSNIEEPSDANVITNIDFTLEQAIEQTVATYSNIMDVFTQAGIDHHTEDMQINEEIYEEIKDSFSTYATPNYIENGLKQIALQYCYSCDNIFIPQNPTCAIHTELKVLSDTEAVLLATYNRNYVNRSATEESILFKLENGEWKIDQSSMQTISLNLNIEQAIEIFEIEGYTGATFVEETMLSIEGGSEETVYIFNTNEGRFAISQNDGYIVVID